MKARLVIFGSRTAFPDRNEINDAVLTLLDPFASISEMRSYVEQVVSGTAAGADQRGEQWAELRGIPVFRQPADWQAHGKIAGRIRNRVMADYATCGVGFWHNESNGTAHMASLLLSMGKPVLLREWRRP